MKRSCMNQADLSNLIWSVADLLRGDYRQSEYGKVILPFTVLRRLDCVLAPTKAKVLAEQAAQMALDASNLYLSEKDEQGKPIKASLERLRDNPGLVERAAISGSLKNLLSYPWVRERVEAGTLVLHGWWFDLDTGDLWASEPGSMQLMPVL